MSKIVQAKAKAKGNVQGVNFRYYTYQYAKELKLKGYVKNTLDGAVEMLVIGNKDVIEKLINKLKDRFSISSFSVNYSEKINDDYSDFQIEY